MSIFKMIGFIVIFVSVFILFYILDSLQEIIQRCDAGQLPADLCTQLKTFSIPSLTFILLIATSLLIVLSTAYQILTKAKESGERAW